MRTYLSGKIHRIPCTEKSIDYTGSASIGRNLLEALGGVIEPFERVQIVNISTGARWETYVIVDERDDAFVANGAAARLVEVGDLCIVMAYATSEVFPGCPVINFIARDEWELKIEKPDQMLNRRTFFPAAP